jgi:hypothetical protein
VCGRGQKLHISIRTHNVYRCVLYRSRGLAVKHRSMNSPASSSNPRRGGVVHWAAHPAGYVPAEGEYAVIRSDENNGEDPQDPIQISDTENAVEADPAPARRSARRQPRPYSVWYGQHQRRRPGVRIVRQRERELIAHILSMVAIIDPHNAGVAAQVMRIRAGEWDQIQIPSLNRVYDLLRTGWTENPVRVNLANRGGVERVQMS